MEHVAQLYRMANESWRGSPEFAALTAAIVVLSTPQPAPVAPVGVEGFDAWFDEYTKNNYTDEMLAEAAWKAALAQQPAPVAPMGAEAAALKQAIEEMEGGAFGGGVSHECLQAMKAALAQQPAAVSLTGVELAQGPDDIPRLLLDGREVATFPAGSWPEVCEAFDFGGYRKEQPAYDGGFTAADMMDARLEGRREACPKCDGTPAGR